METPFVITDSMSYDIESQKPNRKVNHQDIEDHGPRPTTLQFADPKPLGLFSFAVTTTVLSLVNIRAGNVTAPHIAIGLGSLPSNGFLIVGLAYGGMAQFIAGLMEFVRGETFGCVAFTSYGTFWMAFAVMYIPWFNIIDAYGTHAEFQMALGHYLMGKIVLNWLTLAWLLFTLVMTIANIRSSLTFLGMFISLSATIFVLAIANYSGGDVNCTKVGGYLGLIASSFAWYNGASLVWNTENSWITLPHGQFHWAARDH